MNGTVDSTEIVSVKNDGQENERVRGMGSEELLDGETTSSSTTVTSDDPLDDTMS